MARRKRRVAGNYPTERPKNAGVRKNPRGSYPGGSPGGMPNEPIPGTRRKKRR